MDSKKYLVLINGEDKTEEIVKYEQDKNSRENIHIKYKNSIEMCTCTRKDFEFYKDPVEIDMQSNQIYFNEKFDYKVIKILKFNRCYKIFFENNSSKIIQIRDINIVPNDEQLQISTNKLKYLKEISEIVSIKTEEGMKVLTKEYEKINFNEKDTALYKYLNPTDEIEKRDNRKLNELIFPFGANKSQFDAVRNAMDSQISIIEGPPGTGKTQTILNIIANIIKRGKTVAVVSNNNAATDNVYEKLKKYNLDYLCARLGKKENKEEFLKKQTGEYVEFSHKLEEKEVVEKQLKILNKGIKEIFDIQNDIAKLKEQLGELETEHKYFDMYDGKDLKDKLKIRNINKLLSDNIMKLKVEYEEREIINLWFRLKSQFIYGIGNKAFYKKNKNDILKYYNMIFFIARERELLNKIDEKEKRLKLLGSTKLEELASNSIKLLNEYLRQRYDKKVKREIFNNRDLYNNSKKFNREYPIIFSTTYSIKSSLSEKHKYDYIIMDESSQVDLITGALALSVAKNAVIVGDLKQLPNVITTEDKNKIIEISKKYDIPNNYDYLEHSFLESVKETLTNVPNTLLREHYRCHPKIVQFCNKKFYDNQLIIMTEDLGEKDVLKAYITTEGNHERDHYNQRQIDVINKEVIPELAKKVKNKDIGIISPYRKQKDKMQQTLESNFKIDTVHKFQGREEEAIIITTVDNEITEFVDDSKMLNVAVTRAKKYLRLVVSSSENNQNTNIGDLIKYIQYNNFETVESKTKSIYDLLYKQNRKKRLEYLKNKKRISAYDSENLTYKLICEILKENDYANLDIAVHVPLINVLVNTNLLNEEEKAFARNVWTHIDFVIFNKLNKKILLAIEVDGYYFHREGTEQQKRDNIKNKILYKYDVPLIRLSTVESDEKEIIENAIKNIFG